jgi:CMP-N-acetylneuraminic acid synthetase
MLAYTIAAAVDSGVFASVIVSTDSEETAAIARHYGAEVPFLRPSEFSGRYLSRHRVAGARADGAEAAADAHGTPSAC